MKENLKNLLALQTFKRAFQLRVPNDTLLLSYQLSLPDFFAVDLIQQRQLRVRYKKCKLWIPPD